MGRKLDRFFLLLWKNWKLQSRKPVATTIEIIIPILLSCLLAYMRSQLDPEMKEEVQFRSYCPLNRKILNYSTDWRSDLCVDANLWNDDSFRDRTLIYSPTSPLIDNIMDYFTPLVNVQGLDNVTALERYYAVSGSVGAAIQFDDKYASVDNLQEFMKNLVVNIRFPSEVGDTDDGSYNNWQTNLVYPLFQLPGPRSPFSDEGAEPNYFEEGFLTVQHHLVLSLLLANESRTESIEEYIKNFPQVAVQRFPYAAYYSDTMTEILKTMFPLFIIMSFVYSFINTVKAITAEKEKQLKEVMKIMGLPNWLHWSAWFTKCFIFFFTSSMFIVLFIKAPWFSQHGYAVLPNTDTFLIIIFFLFYIFATITFCFAFSSFFAKANNATTVSGLAWFLSYIPYIFVQQNSEDLSLVAKMFISLCHNSALSFGFEVILKFEGNGEGVQWDNLFKAASIDDNLSLGSIMIMLIIDSIIYLMIALYVEAIFPGEYGVAQPWYFIFTKSYWFGDVPYSKLEEMNNLPSSHNPEFFEKDPVDLNPGIQIKKLTKQFGDKIAVNNLTLNMYDDQITVLLGHNGAGKTTTMSMLTGMITPTQGTAYINGFDIRNDIGKVRRSLGLCPQHNVIFDELTVSDHLYFFSKLKGLKGKTLDAEVEKYLKLLALEDKRNAKSRTLSGGMKRKLCVGIALCGGSKIIMLDEPTAGMDPSARRVMWNFIQAQKEGRTILLTTHFMDEADLLGDRIAIMAGGELQCYGSSFFLKKKYGTGYYLVMDKTKECNVQDVTMLLKRFIPGIEVHSNVGSELSYLLAENQSSIFEQMLSALEKESHRLGIRSYGISLSTLEEVFMKVGADHDQEKLDGPIDFNSNKKENSFRTLTPSYSGGWKLIKNQFMAMFLKRLVSIQRSPFLLLCQLLIPALLLVVSVLSARNQNYFAPLKPLPMNLAKFSDPITLIEYSNENNFVTKYKKILQDENYIVEETDSIYKTMIQLTTDTPTVVRNRYIIGSYFEAGNATNKPALRAYFNNDPYHSPGIAFGYLMNAIFKSQSDCEDCSINFVNYPLPYTAETKAKQLTNVSNAGFQFSFNISFAMMFVASFYVLFVVRERISKSKHLQFVSGIRVWIFWTTTILVDMATYILTMIVVIITLAILQEDGFKTGEDLGRIFLILFYYGWSCIPTVYLLGYWFKLPSTGFGRVVLVGLLTGNIIFMVFQVFRMINQSLTNVADSLHWLFLLSPFYSFITGISEGYTTYSYYTMCKEYFESCKINFTGGICYTCIGVDGDYYKWESPGIGRNLMYSFIEGILLFALILAIDYELFGRIIYFIRQKIYPSTPIFVQDEDSDVREERERIKNSHEALLHSNYILSLKDLTKYYGKFLAVNGLCLGVKQYECFGLLGVNGAGKTTTFKMMTGDESISYGDSWVNGLSIKSQLKQVQKFIGYCPQFDALLDDMTAKETIIMFGLIRGIPLQTCKQIPNILAREFDFTKHLDKKVKEMSGGNKRKLSTSLSLIGNPPLLFLDEPTTGMDPATKRYLWNALCKIRDAGKSIILTSHSMEECEALCTRLAIMVCGNFKCLGSTQHLKSKFADGYSLVIKIKKLAQSRGLEHPQTLHVENFVQQNFPRSELKEKHEELLYYHISDKTTPWSKMFGILEEGKRQIADIEDYSLSQSSLEQVFLSFAGAKAIE